MRPRKLQKKKNRKLVLGIATTLGLSTLGLAAYIDKNTLDPKDFEKARWIETYNASGNIWNAYMHENIPHNSANWHAYRQEVWARNLTTRSKYYTRLPDLDGDGKVCNE